VPARAQECIVLELTEVVVDPPNGQFGYATETPVDQIDAAYNSFRSEHSWANCYGSVTLPGAASIPITVRQGNQRVDVLLTLNAVPRGGATGAAALTGAVRLGNRLRAGEFLHRETGTLALGTILVDWLSGVWQITPAEDAGYVRICKTWRTLSCLNVAGGMIVAGPIRPEWSSALWTLEPVPGTGYVLIGNRWRQGAYLHVENSVPEVGANHPMQASAQWFLLRQGGATVPVAPFFSPCLRVTFAALQQGECDGRYRQAAADQALCQPPPLQYRNQRLRDAGGYRRLHPRRARGADRRPQIR